MGVPMKDRHAADQVLEEQSVKWVQGQFTDLMGYLRSFTSPAKEYLEGSLWRNGISMDGSSVGFSRIESSDMNLIPDPETLKILPWSEREMRIARVLVDVYESRTWELFGGDPRNIARRADDEIAAAGFDAAWLSPELEYFVFRSMGDALIENDAWSRNAQSGLVNLKALPQMLSDYNTSRYLIKPHQGYFIAPPVDQTDAFRNDFSSALLSLGVPVKYHHHETGSNQVEVEFRAISSAMRAGDTAMLYKLAARNVGQTHGYVPTFMPKPISADSGNGMHVHMTLWKGGENTFFDEGDERSLSQTARYFMGGILEHAQGMAAITNPTVNSYKRLVLGSEAPVYVAWSSMNRTALIRVPDHTDDPLTVNCEARHPDTSANPYLAFGVLLLAGLDGIKRKLEPGDPTDENIYRLSVERRRQLGIKELPATLGQALDALESDEVAQRALGRDAYERFLDMKRAEWKDFCLYVSPWEHFRYFEI